MGVSHEAHVEFRGLEDTPERRPASRGQSIEARIILWVNRLLVDLIVIGLFWFVGFDGRRSADV
jgi:hypothetical protein